MADDEWTSVAEPPPAANDGWAPVAAAPPEVPLSGPSTTPGIPANYPAPQPAPDPGRMQSILHAFGEGVQEGIGPERFGLSAESDAVLRKAGIFRGEGQSPIWGPFQGFNEGILRPAVAGLDTAWRALQGLQKGTDEAAVKAGLPPPFQTGFDVAASMGFPAGDLALPRRAAAAGETAEASAAAAEAIRPTEELRQAETVAAVQQARELGVIGPEPKSIAEGTAEEAAKAATDHPGAEQPPAPEPTGQTPWKDRFDEFVGKLKTSDDVKSLIIKSAEENDEFQTARAGDIPLAQAEKLSEATGIATRDMDLTGMGRLMKNDAQVRAAMQVMIKTNDDLHFAMQKVAAKGGTDDLAELAELQEARMRRSLAVEQIAGLRAEWGRTGNVFQEFTEASKDTRAFNDFLKDKKGESIDDLRDMAKAGAALDPRTEFPRMINDARREPPGAIYWTWVQGLISGVITHTKYLAANELYSSMERGLVTPLAAIIGKARQLTGTGSDLDRVFFGESAAGLWGQYSSVPTSLIAAGRSVKAGLRAPLEDEVALYKAAIARGEKVPAPIKRAVEASEIPQARPIPGVAGRIIGLPGDVAGGIHTFYKLRGRQAAMESLAYREAVKEGLSPTSGEFWQRQQWHVANPTDAMRAEVIGDSYKATFMQELGPHAKAWQRLTKEVPGVKWVFPFAHIPINLMKATYEGTPFAFMDAEMRDTLTGGKGQAAQDKAIGRMVVGSSVMGYFTLKALNGQATGDYPDDPKERDAWKLAGKEPNSILIGDYWMSYNKFGPAGDLANIGANIAAVVGRATKGDDDAMTAATWKAAEAAAHLVADEVGFQSLQNLFEAMRDEKKGVAWAASTASSFLPFSSLISQTASGGIPFTGGALGDPYMRQAKTFADGLKYRIPGLRETLTPKRDWSGQPIDNPQFGNIIRQRLANTDPVDHEMGALGIHPAPPQDRIGGVKLPAALYDQYQATAGPFTRSALERLVAQPGWSSLPAYTREEVFRKTIAATRQSAAAAMQMAYPALIQTAVQNKVNKITGQPQATMTGP